MDLAELEGLLPVECCEALAELAAGVPADQAIVEIGSYKGRTACWLAAGAARGQGAHVWAVDPWDLPDNRSDPDGRFGFAEPTTRDTFDHQIAAAGFAGSVTAIQALSTDAAADWNGPPIGLLFIDGDHSAGAAALDYWAWAPHLAADATVAFDDYGRRPTPHVTADVDSLAPLLGPYRIVGGQLAIGGHRP